MRLKTTDLAVTVLMGFLTLAGITGGEEKGPHFPPFKMSESEASRLAREEVGRIVSVPENVEITVLVHPSDASGTYRFRLEMDLPADAFALRDRPEVEVHTGSGKVWCWVWKDDMDGSRMASPSIIVQRFLISPGEKDRDPERALRLIRKWTDANRIRSDYDASQDAAYQSLAIAFRKSSHPEGLEDALKDELAHKPGAWAQYAIRHELAKLYTGQKRYAEAVEQVQTARDALKDESGPILTSRYMMALHEIGLIYKASGENQKAAEALEAYLDTTQGQQNCFDAGKELGDLYEQAREWDKARTLYGKVIAIPFPHAANPAFIEEYRNEFRKRLSRLEHREVDANTPYDRTR
jgi:hypothetical protein